MLKTVEKRTSSSLCNMVVSHVFFFFIGLGVRVGHGGNEYVFSSLCFSAKSAVMTLDYPFERSFSLCDAIEDTFWTFLVS